MNASFLAVLLEFDLESILILQKTLLRFFSSVAIDDAESLGSEALQIILMAAYCQLRLAQTRQLNRAGDHKSVIV
jgi:hypothetical protein